MIQFGDVLKQFNRPSYFNVGFVMDKQMQLFSYKFCNGNRQRELMQGWKQQV